LVKRVLKKRVLILVANLPVPPDRRVWHEALALRAAGYTVSVICPKGKGFLAGYECIEDIHIHRYALPLEAAGAFGFLVEYAVTLFWALVLSLKVVFTRGFSIIHACNPPDLYFLLGWLYRPFGKRFVFDFHDLCPELYEVKFGKRGWLHYLLLGLEWLTLKSARVVLATNESFAGIVQQRGGRKPEDVFIVRSAPDGKRFQRTQPDTALRAGASVVVGYVGIMGKQDGIDHLLDAAAVLVRQTGRQRFRFVLVGDGPERPRLEARTRQLGLEDVIIFAGYRTGPALLAAYSSFDLGIIPDPPDVYNHRITMNKTLEFMALQIPFVMFPLEQSRIDAGAAGLVASAATPEALAQALLRLADDAVLQASMRRVAQERTAQLSWDEAKKNLLTAYERAIS